MEFHIGVFGKVELMPDWYASGDNWEHIKYFILPGISLGLVQAALIMRMTCSPVLDKPLNFP